MAAAAAAAANSDDDVVDLGGVGDFDDATKIFFSDGDCGVAHLSWPAAAGIASALTSEASLRALCDKHGVPRAFRPICADHMGWAACTTPPVGSHTMCVYAAALDAGLRFPLHDFYVRLLRHYQLAPSQLLPNAWRFLAAFVLRCEELEVEPLVSAFRHFFTICAHKDDGGKPAGWYHFKPYNEPGRRLFTGMPPIKVGWKLKFFFLQATRTMSWKCPVRWGKPKWENARKVERTDMVIDKLKQKGSVDIKVFLAGREMPVGDQVRLQAAVKAEAGAAAGGAAAAETAGARNKRKSPAATQALPTSAAPGMVCFSIGGGAGDATLPQQQSFAAPTSAPVGLAPPARAFPTPTDVGSSYLQNIAAGSGWTAPPHSGRRIEPTSAHMRSVHAERRAAPDALQFYEAVTRADEQAAIVAKLKGELHLANAWNAQWQRQLAAAEAKHAAERAQWQNDLHVATHNSKHLESKLAQLKIEYAAERTQLVSHLHTAWGEVRELKAEHAQLKEEHAAEKAQLKKELEAEKAQLKEELAADAAQLKKELAADAAQLKKESYTMGVMDMRQLVLHKFPDAIDPVELSPELLLDCNYNDLGCSPVRSKDR